MRLLNFFVFGLNAPSAGKRVFMLSFNDGAITTAKRFTLAGRVFVARKIHLQLLIFAPGFLKPLLCLFGVLPAKQLLNKQAMRQVKSDQLWPDDSHPSCLDIS